MRKNQLNETFKQVAGMHPELKNFIDDKWLTTAFTLIEEGREACLRDHDFLSTAAKSRMQSNIIKHEGEQKQHSFQQINVTVHAPKSKGQEYSYQICFPPPHCVRLMVAFDGDKTNMEVNKTAIDPHPILDNIYASHGDAKEEKHSEDTEVSLKGTIELLNSIRIERIGIVGFARNTPDIDEKTLSSSMQNPTKTHEFLVAATAQHRSFYASTQLEVFLTTLRESQIAHTTVNGGWAGQKGTPRTVGVPFMAHLQSCVNDEKKESFPEYFPPLTVMPSKGTADSVDVAASQDPFVQKIRTEEKETKFSLPRATLAYRSQFIVPGEWGDESPHLAALCTAMVVVEPAGRWTQIEILNGMEQGHPVVILASPENYDKDWMKDVRGYENPVNDSYKALAEGAKFVTLNLPTRENPSATVRAYANPQDAAQYIIWQLALKHLNKPKLREYLESSEGQSELTQMIKNVDEKEVSPISSSSPLQALQGQSKEQLEALLDKSMLKTSDNSQSNACNFSGLFGKYEASSRSFISKGSTLIDPEARAFCT